MLKRGDINKLPTDGYVIFPISLNRTQGDQSPASCIKYLEELDKKINIPGNDVVFLYTNGLYFNSTEKGYKIRKRTNKQMLSHKRALQKLIIKKHIYMPQAFHFLPFDYILLNSDYFETFFDKLQHTLKKDKQFKQYLIKGLGGRKNNEANINFLLEEIAVSHIIREHLVELPKSLVKKDNFRLIIYPGAIFKAEIYIWQKKNITTKKPKDIRKIL